MYSLDRLQSRAIVNVQGCIPYLKDETSLCGTWNSAGSRVRSTPTTYVKWVEIVA